MKYFKSEKYLAILTFFNEKFKHFDKVRRTKLNYGKISRVWNFKNKRENALFTCVFFLYFFSTTSAQF